RDFEAGNAGLRSNVDELGIVSVVRSRSLIDDKIVLYFDISTLSTNELNNGGASCTDQFDGVVVEFEVDDPICFSADHSRHASLYIIEDIMVNFPVFVRLIVSVDVVPRVSDTPDSSVEVVMIDLGIVNAELKTVVADTRVIKNVVINTDSLVTLCRLIFVVGY